MKKISKDFNNLFVSTYSRSGNPLVSGKGMYLFDSAGVKYLDFGAGIAVNALGHAHPALVKALCAQGKKLVHGSNLYLLQAQIDLAALLLKHSFGDRVFFCNSGTEAIEAAIKFSRKWATAQDPEKYHVLSFYHGFHGRTYAAMSATAQGKFHEGFKPLVPGFHYAALNDIAGAKLELDKHKFAAVIVEPVQGEGGIIAAKKEFLLFLREYCDTHDVALVFDEIQCGMGRTGTLWNYEQHGIKPDLMAAAKPLGGGLPLGTVICKAKIVSGIQPGNHGTTFGGNPVACALGCEVLKIITAKTFLKSVTQKGEYIKKRLASASKGLSAVKEIRGTGLLVGVELAFDPKDIIPACKEKGLLVIKAENNTVRFMPPLIVEKSHIDAAVKIFTEVVRGAV